MRKTIPMVALAALVLCTSAALAEDTVPVCGDVNDSSTINTTDALLVLRKSVMLPGDLQCTAYEAQFSTCLRDAEPTLIAVGDGDGGGFVTTSVDDGFTWVDAAVQPAGASKLEGVAKNGTTAVAVGGASAYRSIDSGATWTAASTQPSGQFLDLRDVATNGSRMVAVANNAAFFSDDDGDTWNAATVPPANASTGVAGHGNTWVAVGGVKAFRSLDDGETWTAATTQPPAAFQLVRVATNGNAWVAVGRTLAGGSTPVVYTSADGDTWVAATTQPVGAAVLIDSVATNGTRFVIGSYNGRIFVSDDDGDTWSPAANVPVSGIAINAIAFHGHLCVALDLGGNTHWSPDSGTHWYEAHVESVGIAGFYGAAR